MDPGHQFLGTCGSYWHCTSADGVDRGVQSTEASHKGASMAAILPSLLMEQPFRYYCRILPSECWLERP